MNKTTFHHVYQFKISLDNISPSVWRRIQVPETYTFWDLHVAIQDSMGWLDYHLHQFETKNPKTGAKEIIGIPEEIYDDVPYDLPLPFVPCHSAGSRWRSRGVTLREDSFYFMGQNGITMHTLARYESMLEKAFYRAFHELQRLQAMRLGHPVALPIAIDTEMNEQENWL